MARAREFYEGLIGLQAGVADGRITSYRIGDTMLLLFLRGATVQPVELPGGTIPAHDGHGPAHFAFAIGAEDFDRWRERLTENGVEIISTVRWPGSMSISLYFHDPDGHVVEMATPGLWGID